MKAFLSHTSADKDLVSLVHAKLEKNNAWYDATDIENGENIPDKINEGLRHATHYVLFWSKKASESRWVHAELNTAFVRMMANKCKFMIFMLDDSQLPELLQPYKYEYIDKKDLETAALIITEKIMAQEGAITKLSEFVNRTKELGDIEEAVRAGYKLIILNGILGIGKSVLAEKAVGWLYPNRAMTCIIIDFNKIPGIAELTMELSYQTKKKLINRNLSVKEQQNNIKYFLEYISACNSVLILKDVKGWLNEDGSVNQNLLFILDLVIKTPMFSYITIMTTTRYVDIPSEYYQYTTQMSIRGMDDNHISHIIKNNLPMSFEVDENKNLDFANRLYGYPLGAKLGAYRIANHGYDYYLQQPRKIHELKVSLAKSLISYADISNECLEYLKVVALCKSRLRNDEYIMAFSMFSENITKLSDEAFFAGILKYGEDGCYKLELLVEDYFYDLAFNDVKCKEYCICLEKFLLDRIKNENDDYMRLVPIAVHILTLNGNIDQARKIRTELTSTIASSMWDLYNHQDYDKAKKVSEQLLNIDEENIEAKYIKALCLTRFDEYGEAEGILETLMDIDKENISRYYYALGRIQKKQGFYSKAIELFQIAINKKRRYLSPYRELAECYILMDNIADAKVAIAKAKEIDESNIFIILLEARLLQKENRADEAIELLENQSILETKSDQVFFRKGRAFDQLGQIREAKECYIKALKNNPKAYDAKLCLLSHQIIDEPQVAEKDIKELKEELRGKRKFILINIQARFVGYQNHDEDKAIELLDNVPHKFRDRQWYAVRMQLLENLYEKHKGAQRELLAEAYKKELEDLSDTIERKYGNRVLEEADLLPDT